MATIGNLIVKIGANVEGLKQGIGKSRGMIGGLTGKLGGLGGIAGAAATGGLALAAGAIVGIGASAVGVGAQVVDLSTQIDQSQRDIGAALGTTQAESERLGELAVQVWEDQFAGSVAEATDFIIEARKQLGGLADEELLDASENAARLGDAFDADINQSLNSAGTLIDNFGLSQQQAFDFLASGFQEGLDNSGDFLDSVGEYSNIFADAGFSAEQMFSIMQSGLEGGVLGSDKIADSIKEMNVRLSEGGSEVSSAFDSIGLDFEQIQASVASGDTAWADYFDSIVGGINGIEDPIARGQAQVAIFGTMAEDLGPSFTEGLSSGLASMEDMAGAVDKVDQKYDSLSAVATGMWRSTLVALQPVGEALLGLANDAMPFVNDIFEKAKPVIAEFGDELGGTLKPAALVIKDAFQRIGEALGILNEETDQADVLIGALGVTLDLVVTGVEASAIFFQLLALAVEAVAFHFKSATRWIGDLGRGLSGLGDKLPDWLTPGSPTPLEIGLKGISEAFKGIPKLDDVFQANVPGLAGAGAAAGGGGNTSIYNIDGVSATAVGAADPVDQAIRMTVEALRERLKR